MEQNNSTLSVIDESEYNDDGSLRLYRYLMPEESAQGLRILNSVYDYTLSMWLENAISTDAKLEAYRKIHNSMRLLISYL